MRPSELSTPASNPFCAARLRPGTIDYIFDGTTNLDQLVATLAANRWRGQITGPHGSGKSTLLAAMRPAIQAAGRDVHLLVMTDDDRNLPRFFLKSLRGSSPSVAAIDGFEQLSAWNRLRLKWFCRRQGVGLVVTTHHSAGLPDVCRTSIDLLRAWQVVERLQAGFAVLIQRSDLIECLARRRGDLREALFDLYDLYEKR